MHKCSGYCWVFVGHENIYEKNLLMWLLLPLIDQRFSVLTTHASSFTFSLIYKCGQNISWFFFFFGGNLWKQVKGTCRWKVPDVSIRCLCIAQILLEIVFVIYLSEWDMEAAEVGIQHSPLNEVVKCCFLRLFLIVIDMFNTSISGYKR